MKPGDIPIMLDCLRTCIKTAFDHEQEFLERFGRRNRTFLQSLYMASQRTVYTAGITGGRLVEDTISTDEFIEWVFEQRKAD